MDSFEKNARKVHGDSTYGNIWTARLTNKKYLWFVVLFETLAQLLWKSIFVGCVTYSVVSSFEFLVFGDQMVIGFGPFIIMVAMLSPLLEVLFDSKSAFRNTSNFIAVAGDMNRVTKNESYGIPWKVVAKITFYASGVLAVLSAFSIWIVKRNSLATLENSELDVLGNALTNGKFFWAESGLVFIELTKRYQKRSSNMESALQISVSFALACKWRMNCVKVTKGEKAQCQESIQRVMSDYPDLPMEITLRLKEALER